MLGILSSHYSRRIKKPHTSANIFVPQQLTEKLLFDHSLTDHGISSVYHHLRNEQEVGKAFFMSMGEANLGSEEDLANTTLAKTML